MTADSDNTFVAAADITVAVAAAVGVDNTFALRSADVAASVDGATVESFAAVVGVAVDSISEYFVVPQHFVSASSISVGEDFLFLKKEPEKYLEDV